MVFCLSLYVVALTVVGMFAAFFPRFLDTVTGKGNVHAYTAPIDACMELVALPAPTVYSIPFDSEWAGPAIDVDLSGLFTTVQIVTRDLTGEILAILERTRNDLDWEMRNIRKDRRVKGFTVAMA
jgi:hypothetical protein